MSGCTDQPIELLGILLIGKDQSNVPNRECSEYLAEFDLDSTGS